MSTKNAFLDKSSQTDKVPDGAAETILIWWEVMAPGVTVARRDRFPALAWDAKHCALNSVQDLSTYMPDL